MQPRTSSRFRHRDVELWTRDDADAWREAQLEPIPDAWTEDDVLLDSDLWLEDPLPSLQLLGIRAI